MVIHGKPEQRSPHLENIPAVAYRRTVGPGSILTFCNEYTRELFGYLPEELTEEPSMPFYRLLHPGDRERIINELEQVNQRGDEFHLQYRMLTRDKQTVRVSDRGRIIPSKSNESRAYEGIITPRSDPAQVDSLSGNEIVRTDGSQNKYDFLTGLPNRPWFLEQVENRIQEVLGGKRPFDHFSLVLLDLDNFQRVNDFFGRSVGDSVIEKMGALVESSFDDRAITGRIGSSRFGCFFPHPPT